MRIYIVRHGATESNQEKIRQSGAGYLSDDGIQEARAAASRLSSLKIDSIFTSSYPRAKQTADIISALGKGLLVQVSEYLTEIRLPSEIVGHPTDDPKSLKILSWLKGHSESTTARYSDEETYNEYVSRAHAVLNHIEKTGFENTVVVTHHRFIHILIAVVLLGEKLTPESFEAIRSHIFISNTGITVIQKNEEKDRQWHILTLNEHSHLDEVGNHV